MKKLVILCLLLSGCTSGRKEIPIEEVQAGHRYVLQTGEHIKSLSELTVTSVHAEYIVTEERGMMHKDLFHYHFPSGTWYTIIEEIK